MAARRSSSETRESSDPLAVGMVRPWRKYALSLLLVLVGMTISIAIRVKVFGFHGSDLDRGFLPWCDKIEKVGLAQALKEGSIDYNPTYIYLLWLVTKLPLDRALLVKLISVFFD